MSIFNRNKVNWQEKHLEILNAYDDARQDLDRIRLKNANLESAVNALTKSSKEKDEKIAELNAKVREQCEADLYYACVKLERAILENKPKEEKNMLTISAQLAYNNLMAQTGNLGGMYGYRGMGPNQLGIFGV
jgi:HD superfamily phosphohydrolase